MTNFLIIALAVLLAAAAVIIVYLLSKKSNQPATMATLLERLTQLGEQNRQLAAKLDSSLRDVNEAGRAQFSETARLLESVSRDSNRYIADVTAKLTKLDETNKQIINFSSQLQNLQDILKNPKQRGVLGEFFLEEILKNVLPPGSYQIQYPFSDGAIVDAVIFIKDKVIPVDSKFSLENYEKILAAKDDETKEKLEKQFKQDLRNRIDETAKYIRPGEKTMDFAFMFIPSEAIYYDLLVNKVGAVKINTRDLIEYAIRDKHVIIVSPTSFLAYLQTVLQGLKAMQIEESAKEIMANVEKLGRHLNSYEEFLKKLGSGLQISVNHYNNAYKEFKKVDKDVAKITAGESAVETLLLDKPELE